MSRRPAATPKTVRPATAAPLPWVEVLTAKVSAIRYGTVTLTVHQGRVVQVECTERTRLATDTAPPGEFSI